MRKTKPVRGAKEADTSLNWSIGLISTSGVGEGGSIPPLRYSSASAITSFSMNLEFWSINFSSDRVIDKESHSEINSNEFY